MFQSQISEIALLLNRHRSTIYREIKRNTMQPGKNNRYSWPYRAMNAGNLAHLRKQAQGTVTKSTSKLIDQITHYLELKFSPEQIACGVPGISVCTTTIYNWIYKKIIKFNIKKLRRRGKHYKPSLEGMLVRRPDNEWFEKHSIEKRPTAITDREEFGHWEADSVFSKKNSKVAVATFVERKTRKYVTYKMPEKNSAHMYQAMCRLIHSFPNAVKSITCDRGSEFINQEYVKEIERKNVIIYMAHAYSPQERGSNENHNGLLREYYPKGTDFKHVLEKALTNCAASINARPRKMHKWQTAQILFEAAVDKIKLN